MESKDSWEEICGDRIPTPGAGQKDRLEALKLLRAPGAAAMGRRKEGQHSPGMTPELKNMGHKKKHKNIIDEIHSLICFIHETSNFRQKKMGEIAALFSPT